MPIYRSMPLSESMSALLLLAGLIVLIVGLAIWTPVAALIGAGCALCFLALVWNRGGDGQ